MSDSSHLQICHNIVSHFISIKLSNLRITRRRSERCSCDTSSIISQLFKIKMQFSSKLIDMCDVFNSNDFGILPQTCQYLTVIRPKKFLVSSSKWASLVQEFLILSSKLFRSDSTFVVWDCPNRWTCSLNLVCCKLRFSALSWWFET